MYKEFARTAERLPKVSTELAGSIDAARTLVAEARNEKQRILTDS
jgi:hypothetical protein